MLDPALVQAAVDLVGPDAAGVGLDEGEQRPAAVRCGPGARRSTPDMRRLQPSSASSPQAKISIRARSGS